MLIFLIIVDECHINPCRDSATCENTPESYLCKCDHGFIYIAENKCVGEFMFIANYHALLSKTSWKMHLCHSFNINLVITILTIWVRANY